MESKKKYRVKADKAEIYGFDGNTFFRMEHAPVKPYIKGQVVPGVLRTVNTVEGKPISAIQVAKFYYLKPEDVAQLDVHGKEVLTFTEQGGERLEHHTGVFAKTLADSPVDAYLSAEGKDEIEAEATDTTSLFKLQRPRPVFKVEDNKLVKTGESLPTDEKIMAKPVKMKVGDKVRLLLELSPNTYIQHIGVEPITLFDLNADAGATPEEGSPLKKYNESSDCLAYCENHKPMWVNVFPLLGVALGAVLAHQRKAGWVEFAGLMAVGGVAGFGVVIVGNKMAGKHIVKK